MKTLSFADYVPEPLRHLTEPMQKEQISDFLFCLACSRNLSDQEVMALCSIAGVSYPPVQEVK